MLRRQRHDDEQRPGRIQGPVGDGEPHRQQVVGAQDLDREVGEGEPPAMMTVPPAATCAAPVPVAVNAVSRPSDCTVTAEREPQGGASGR